MAERMMQPALVRNSGLGKKKARMKGFETAKMKAVLKRERLKLQEKKTERVCLRVPNWVHLERLVQMVLPELTGGRWAQAAASALQALPIQAHSIPAQKQKLSG